MFNILIIIVIVIAALVGITLLISHLDSLRRKRDFRTITTPQPAPLTLQSIGIGDIVQYLDRDWVIEDKLRYEEVCDGQENGQERYIWFDYMLQDGNDIRWLSVEEDDSLKISMLEQISNLELVKPPPQKLTHEGITYQLQEHGIAKMTRSSSSMRPSTEQCSYFDYEGPFNRVLSIEEWNVKIETTVGTIISLEHLNFMRGTDYNAHF